MNHQNNFHDSLLDLLFDLTVIKSSLLNKGFLPIWLQFEFSGQIQQVDDVGAKPIDSLLEAGMCGQGMTGCVVCVGH
jgi:hypothetical protein